MTKKDVWLSALAGALIGVFSLLTIHSVKAYLPPLVSSLLPLILFLGSLAGIFLAWLIGKKFPVIFQIAKFGLIGILNTLIDFGVINILANIFNVYQGAAIIPLNALSFSLAVINSYFWNKYWTFREGSQSPESRYGFVKFVVVSILGLLINTAIVYGMTALSPAGVGGALWLNSSKLLATVVSMIWNFLGYKFLVFIRREKA